jgi:hypothetical protein
VYILDANVLIAAHRKYYGIDQVPEYWEWLQHHAAQGTIKLPAEIHSEIKYDKDNPDLLAEWAYAENVKAHLILPEEVPIPLVQSVLQDGYAPDLNDIEIEEIGADPFLMAAALMDPRNRTVVTVEVSKRTKTRANRRIPDVCDDLGVHWIDEHTFARDLGFSTNWKARI